MTARPPRIVLVEDDPAMQLYVETALRHLEFELVFCHSVAQAMAAFDAGPVHLLITDLMLPGESGIDLIERLRADPARYGRPRTLVTSAAIDAPGIKAHLQALGVWRLLPKPVALDTLESCVVDALGTPQAGASATAGRAGERPAGVVDAYFAGDESLYGAYRSACLNQFEADVDLGDRSLALPDAGALRRLAHNLRSVLQTLGEDGAAAVARSLEASALASDLPAARALWTGLRAALLEMRRAG